MGRDYVNWGILGTGGIALKMAAAMRECQTCRLVAIAGRSLASAARIAAEFRGVEAYGTYEELLADSRVEAIYLALPNHLHAEWTIKAVRMGRHILCEKPFCLSAVEASVALTEVRRAGVFFQEAFMYRSHPQTRLLAKLIGDGAIGSVRLIEVTFTIELGAQPQNIRCQRETGGGGILDLGCYTVSLARLLAGAVVQLPFDNPVAVGGLIGCEHVSGVDHVAGAMLLFQSGCFAAMVVGMQVKSDRTVRVWGTDGSLQVANPWMPPERGANIWHSSRTEEGVRRIVVPESASLYAQEIEHVTSLIRSGQTESPYTKWDDTLGNMMVLDRWRTSASSVPLPSTYV